jgi:hypothetical protein
MKRLVTPWLLLTAVLGATAAIRFVELGRAAVRSDEINFLEYAVRGQSLLALWRNPPWLNQIPLADSIAIVWHWFRTGPPTEQTLREPFALLGTLTVAGVAVWLTRRRGLAAGVLVGVWMAFLPFHVAQSREAYYYVVVMAAAAGMTLSTADLLTRLRAGEQLSAKAYAAWTSWTVLTCLTHMSTWVVAACCWLLMLGFGIRFLPPQMRRRHVIGMIVAAVITMAFMARWVWRAVAELKRVSDGTGHIGGDFSWVGPWVIPSFTAGANAIGVAACALALAAGAFVLAKLQKRESPRRDFLYDSLTLITYAGFAASYAYVGAVGGGVAKITYFSVLLPVFLAWVAYTFDIVAANLPGRWPMVTRLAIPCAVVSLFAQPAWMVTRLDGKPSPYKRIRDWLDDNLDPGSVVVVDRWLEPWNEMARYAPSKVFVTFTVPDEPYETYRQLRWREVTEDFIERGGAQAFIRLVRNHEHRDGLWTWPERHFARRVAIVNDAAAWLSQNGYGALERYPTSSAHQLTTEIFYDLRADVVARKRAAGDRFAVFYDGTLPYEKSGPMGIFRVKTQQFMDWRVLYDSGMFDVFNLTDKEQRAVVKLSGAAPAGPKSVIGPEDARKEFSAGELQEWLIGPVMLAPGSNTLTLTDPRWAESPSPLFIAGITIEPVADSPQ